MVAAAKSGGASSLRPEFRTRSQGGPRGAERGRCTRNGRKQAFPFWSWSLGTFSLIRVGQSIFAEYCRFGEGNRKTEGASGLSLSLSLVLMVFAGRWEVNWDESFKEWCTLWSLSCGKREQGTY